MFVSYFQVLINCLCLKFYIKTVNLVKKSGLVSGFQESHSALRFLCPKELHISELKLLYHLPGILYRETGCICV